MASLRSALVRFLLRRADLWNKPLSDIRKSLESIKGRGLPRGLELRKENIKGVAVERLTPPGAPEKKAILYFHGGGFCLGIYPANREFVARIAMESGLPVVLPDYRLAPENPFPAALEDAVAVYKGLMGEGYTEKDVVVMGDSSGCALALSALLVLKQSGVAMPSSLAFITPVFDLAGTGETFVSRAPKDPFRLKDPLGIAKLYVGANNPSSPVLSPLYGDLAGLPKAIIHAADYDVFLSDSVRLAERAKKAGVQVELKVWRKMWHIFHMQAAVVPEAEKAVKELGL